jgi:hypothetical protein
VTRLLPALGILAEWFGRLAGAVAKLPVVEVAGAGFVVAGIAEFSYGLALIAVGLFLLLAARQATR